MLGPMPESSGERHPASRLHVGGKLSFRRRLRKGPAPSHENLPLIELREDPPALAELVPEGYADVEIEVGPGKGAFLLAATGARPDTFFVGIEASPSYAEHVATQLREHERTNGLLLIDNAKVYLQDRVDDGALARLHVYFADPWPKRRHKRRRFFTDDFPPVIARVLRPGGHLLVATDNPAYAGQIGRVLGASEHLLRDEAEEERLLNAPPGHGFSPTNFEIKYRREERIIRRYAFRRP